MKRSEIMKERRVFVLIMLVLAISFFYVVGPFITPAIVAAIVATLFFPLYSKINDRLGDKPRTSSLFTTLIIFFILILPTAWLALILFGEISELLYTLDLKHTFSEVFNMDFYQFFIKPTLEDIEAQIGQPIDLLGMLTNFAKGLATSVYKYSPSVLIGTFNFIFNFFIMMAALYFFFVEGKQLLKVVYDISPLRENHERRLTARVRETLEASVYGYLVTGIVQGILAGTIFAFIGIESFVVLGTLTFFFSMVPIVGSAGVWGPVFLWVSLQGQFWWQGLFLLLGGIFIISGIDNFLKPIIIDRGAKIHPLLIFFCLFGGIQLFGPLGILFGPVITALFIATITIYREEFV